MKKVMIKKQGTVLTSNAETAYTFISRFRGLMFRKAIADDFALHIKPCNQIHMLNMRFAIDVIYLDKKLNVVKVDENVQPGVICKTVKAAHSVLEMKSGASAKLGIVQGDTLEIEER